MAEADPIAREPAALQAEIPSTHPAKPARSSPWRWVLMLSVPLLVLAGAAVYWLGLQGKAITDNAYVKLEKVSISAEVGGTIVEVAVAENQQVEAGQLLFRIDPEPFRIQLAQATAAIAGAQANVTALANASALSGADIAAAREDIAFAEANFRRKDELYRRGFLTKTEHDAAEHAINQAREGLHEAEADARAARAQLATGAAVPGENPQIAAARASRDAARLNLARTEIRAPAAGRIAEADRLQIGQQVLPGLPVMTLVRRDGAYVEANFKETDLADMRVGQPADIRFDAYPGLTLKGHVASIGAGTGSEFSVLPAQNATGNWVKVTQRVPVRIAFDEASPRMLIAGLSTTVVVHTDESGH